MYLRGATLPGQPPRGGSGLGPLLLSDQPGVVLTSCVASVSEGTLS